MSRASAAGRSPPRFTTLPAICCATRGNEYGAVTGRPRRCGWLDIPLLRYSNQVNGAEWLVVTKLDVLDELDEIPVCIGYEIGGKVTDEIPADVDGLEAIKPRYTTLKGWRQSTEGITEFDKLPQAARDYLAFQERESGAQDRHGLHRPRPRPDHRAAGFCRGAGSHHVLIRGSASISSASRARTACQLDRSAARRLHEISI